MSRCALDSVEIELAALALARARLAAVGAPYAPPLYCLTPISTPEPDVHVKKND